MQSSSCRSRRIRLAALALSLSLSLLAGCGSSSSGSGLSGSGSSGSGSSTTPTLQSLSASAATAAVAVGATDQLTATATYSDGSTKNVTTSATWTDSDTKIATISAAGLATAVAPGSTTATAAYSGFTATVALTVPQAAKTLASIAIAPAAPSLVVGATRQLTATGTYSDGSAANVTASVTWSSSAKSIATVTAAGIATAIAPGTATITASLSGIAGSTSLSVSAASKTLSSIAVMAATPSVAAGSTDQLTATATYSDGSTANVTNSVTWTSSSTSVATVSAGGLVTGVAPGSATVTATLGQAHAGVTLAVTHALRSIAVSPAAPSLTNGGTQQFTATATYSDGTTANVTAPVTWTSSNTKTLTIAPGGLGTAVAAGTATVTATLNGVSGAATVTVTGISSIAITPSTASFAMAATQQFTATASYSDGTTADITALGTWSIANTDVATIASGGLATGVAAGTSTVTVTYQGVTGSLAITVTLPAGAAVSIPTWHADAYRSGLNSGEIALTPANVAPATFGKLFSYLVDGYAYAEPLVISGVTVNGAVHNVLYVATENDTVYAFDADNYGTGAPLWQTSLLKSGESPLNAVIQPNQGITGTPVVDPTTNTLYVVSAQTSKTSGSGYRLNALDITTGKPKFGSPVAITASVPGTNATAVGGQVALPGGCIQRTALLLANGNIYMGIGSCHEGWVLAYSASTLAQVGVFNVSPNLDGEGAYASAGGVWMGSGGPVADSSGNVYVSTGNGPWDTTQAAYSDSVLKFDPSLKLLDYFTPQDYAYMFCDDSDLAAGGLLMIPGTGQIIGGGKMGELYLLNSANLGHEQAGDAGAIQTIFAEQGIASPYKSQVCPDSAGNHTAMINSYEIFGTPAYFNGSLYIGVTPTSPSPFGVIHRFGYDAGSSTPLTAQEASSPSIQQNTRGTTPFISANGNADGILWMIDEGQPIGGSTAPTHAALRAYDAQNLANEIYDSTQNSGDAPGYGIKFTSPIVANGKVYISTGHATIGSSGSLGEIDVYGLH